MNNIKTTHLVALFILFGCSSVKPVTELSGPKAEHPINPILIGSTTKEASEVAALPPKPRYEDYQRYAFINSEELKSAFYKYRASIETAPQISSLPDPKLTYSYFVDSIETRVGPMKHRFRLMQDIPWFGKLELREKAAYAKSSAAYFAALTIKNKIMSELAKSYFEIVYLNRAIEVTQANLELLKRWEQVVSQRYRSQAGSQAALIKVQVELGKLEDKLYQLEDLKSPLFAELNSILSLPATTPVYIASNGLSEQSKENQMASTSIDPEQALSSNPELLLLGSLLEAKKYGVELAEKDFFPDLAIGITHTAIGEREQAGGEGGDDALAGMVSFTLPLYRSKYKAALRQAESEQKGLDRALKAKRDKLSAKLSRALFNLKDSERRVGLYKDTLVPKAEESMESTFTAFEAGEASFLDLLDSERVYLEFQLHLARAKADFRISQAQRNAILGNYSDLKVTEDN